MQPHGTSPANRSCPPVGTPDAYACLEWKAPLGWAPWALGTADLSGDGEKQIIVGNSFGELYVFNGTSHALLANDRIANVTWLRGAAAADLDGDGRMEVAVGSTDVVGQTYYGRVRILEWNGSALAPEWKSSDMAEAVHGLRIGDLDADGVPVVAAATDNGVYSVKYNATAGTYQARGPSRPFSEVHDIEIAEIDDDPVPEILVTDLTGLYVLDGPTLSIEWELTWLTDYRFGYSFGLAVGDLDGDGGADIAVGTTSTPGVWLIVDAATRTVTKEIPSPVQNVDAAIADVDRDGREELLTTAAQDRNQSGGNSYGYLVVRDGSTFRWEWRSPNLWFPGFDFMVYQVMAGDVDDDPRIEVLVSTYGGVFQFEVASGQAPNRPPTAALAPVVAVEGSPALLDASGSSDPDGDPLQYAWDWDNDGVLDTAWSAAPTAEHTWGDDFTGVVAVHVSDGQAESVATAAVTVLNAPPGIAGIEAACNASLFLRIAGEKWHDVRVVLYKDGAAVGAANATRRPGSPDDQTVAVSTPVNLLENYSAEVLYTPEDDPPNGQLWGDTPAWLILVFEDGSEARLPHNFNVRHPDTWTWEIASFPSYAIGLPIRLRATVTDPGSDDLTFTWDFGDGSPPVAAFHPNPGGVFPFTATDEQTCAYTTAGTYRVTLRVADDDGGVSDAVLIVTI